jgi:transcriptional regulator with XRE-family HTH domain
VLRVTACSAPKTPPPKPKPSTPQQVGQKLLKARERAGLSKGQLARGTGVTESQIRHWERGNHIPSATNLMRIIPLIGGTIEDYLFQNRKR